MKVSHYRLFDNQHDNADENFQAPDEYDNNKYKVLPRLEVQHNGGNSYDRIDESACKYYAVKDAHRPHPVWIKASSPTRLNTAPVPKDTADRAIHNTVWLNPKVICKLNYMSNVDLSVLLHV